MQTVKQALQANAREWARNLTNDEIARLLDERRTEYTKEQVAALIAESRRRAGMFGNLEAVKQESRARGALIFVVWNGYAFEERHIPAKGFGGCLVGTRSDVNAEIATNKTVFGMVAYTN